MLVYRYLTFENFALTIQFNFKISQHYNTYAFQKKNFTPLKKSISYFFFEVDLPGFPFYYVRKYFNFFFQRPTPPSLEIRLFVKFDVFSLNLTFFFVKFWHTPWNSKDFYFTALEFSIDDILNRAGGYGFFFSKSSFIIINKNNLLTGFAGRICRFMVNNLIS